MYSSCIRSRIYVPTSLRTKDLKTKEIIWSSIQEICLFSLYLPVCLFNQLCISVDTYFILWIIIYYLIILLFYFFCCCYSKLAIGNSFSQLQLHFNTSALLWDFSLYFEHFLTLQAHLQIQQDYLLFLSMMLKSTICPRRPDSFYWRIVLENDIWLPIIHIIHFYLLLIPCTDGMQNQDSNTLLTGMQTGTATLENKIAFYYKIKHTLFNAENASSPIPLP